MLHAKGHRATRHEAELQEGLSPEEFLQHARQQITGSPPIISKQMPLSAQPANGHRPIATCLLPPRRPVSPEDRSITVSPPLEGIFEPSPHLWADRLPELK